MAQASWPFRPGITEDRLVAPPATDAPADPPEPTPDPLRPERDAHGDVVLVIELISDPELH
ncbi:hypothetical protein [Nocardia sp. NBC_00416]|uniref:hypothetical protein n=1 Tax=Nocardia sp. NBC_00416 TaxID=2975991 RepID=UPI002E1D6467